MGLSTAESPWRREEALVRERGSEWNGLSAPRPSLPSDKEAREDAAALLAAAACKAATAAYESALLAVVLSRNRSKLSKRSSVTPEGR